MRIPTKILFAGKLWDVIPLACGYMWRLRSGNKQFPVNLDELLQMEHGK